MGKQITSKTSYSGVPTLEALEGADAYNQWILENFSSEIVTPILEIGSGKGTISELLVPFSPLTLSDNQQTFVDYLEKKFKQEAKVHATNLDITKTPPKKLQNYFKTIIGINVLEHIKDDESTLKNLYTLLAKNGKLMLLVPAKKFAYTRLDKSLGHFRRYEKEELERKVKSAGFKINKIYYFNFLGLISWKARDILSKSNSQLSKGQIQLFCLLVPFLKRIEKIITIPFGVSVILIAQKNEKRN